jgi:dipeptidyl aminopeptidase/acylaminoacyl peptidase
MLRTLIALLILGCTCAAQTQPKDGEILSRKPFEVPAFGSVKEIAQYATEAEYRDAASDKNFTLERILYSSDGLPVSAYLYGAIKSDSKLPVIVFIRGSYVVRDQGAVLLTMFHRLAKSDFVVIAPMLRGSDGQPGHDELGGSDLHDVANIFPVIRQLEFADAQNVFMYGESRGGIMTLLSLRAKLPVKAAATFGAITDMDAYLHLHEKEANSATKIWPDFNQNRSVILELRSAQKWTEEITTPILLMHGAADPQVPPAQTLQLASQLAKQGSNYGVIIYPGDNHILSHHRQDRDREVTQWFQSFLTGDPAK